MKLLVDMNLSPSWVERLARHGFEAVHWSTIGAATSPDHEILEWAHEHDFVVIANDLDFSAILAAGAVDGPSVVQIRAQDLLSDGTISIVAKALEAHRDSSAGIVEIHQIHMAFGRYDSCLIERYQVLARAALCRLMPPRVLHWDLPPQVRSNAEEMGPILPPDSRLVDELQIDLIDEGGARQRVIRTLASQRAPRGAPEFTVYNGKQFVERVLTPVAPLDKQLG